MRAPRTTIWTIKRHTSIKHEILRRYLEWWLPTALKKYGRITVLDGFAGPGEYGGGEIGSPLIAIDILLKYFPVPSQHCNASFVFIEENRKRCRYLLEVIKRREALQSQPPALKYNILQENFARYIDKKWTVLEQKQEFLAPTFAFIDPYGFSDIPIHLIRRLMCHPNCEIFITFMYEEINRFLSKSDKKLEYHYDNLFGTPDWRKIVQFPNQYQTREQQICSLYCAQLRIVCDVRYVGQFRMRNRKNTTDYFLIFGTNQRDNLEKMKDVFWEIDTLNGYTFSDLENPAQMRLLQLGPDHDILKQLLVSQFHRATVSMYDIDEYILSETRFRISKDKECVLSAMERASLIKVISLNPNRMLGEFAETDCITFL